MLSTEECTTREVKNLGLQALISSTGLLSSSTRPNCNISNATLAVMNSLNSMINDGNYSSSLSPDDSPVHAANSSSDNIYTNSSEKAKKRKLTADSSEDEETAANHKLVKSIDHPNINECGSEVKCPCCMRFVPARQFSLHGCFRQLANQLLPSGGALKLDIDQQPQPQQHPEVNMTDLNMLFTLFKGTSQFKDRLLQLIESNFELINNKQKVINYSSIALELYAQTSSGRVFNPRDLLIFHFDDLTSWQMLSTSNQCLTCQPKRSFLLPSNYILHTQIHHELNDSNATILKLIQCVEQSLSNETSSNDVYSPFQFLSRLKSLMSEGLQSPIKGPLMNQQNPNINFDFKSALNMFSNVILKAQVPLNNNNTENLLQTPLDESLELNAAKKSFNPLGTDQTNGRRGRTRLTSNQLSILRSYFDINNSPTEDKIVEICSKTGLQEKVVKHWFRNTLFKERQKNKDNPYNFSVPPSTSIDLEVYEKTGKIEIKPALSEIHTETYESKSTSSSVPSFNMAQLFENKYFTDKPLQLNLKEYSDDDESNASAESLSRGSVGSEKRLSSSSKTQIIKPDQIEILKSHYQSDPNMSLKSIERLAKDIGLNKKIVQNWFQTTRLLTERKSMISNEINAGVNQNPFGILIGQCPFCSFCLEPLMYRLNPTLLHMHIATKHTEENPFIANFSSILLNSGQQPENNISFDNLQQAGLMQDSNKSLEEIPLDLSNAQQFTSTLLPTGIFGQLSSLNVSSPNLKFSLINMPKNETVSNNNNEEIRIDEHRNGQISSLLPSMMFGLGVEKQQTNVNPCALNQQARRNRTSISNFQSKCMTAIYEYHKTPSVQECDRLGEFIGLSRRVVQVWFQNQRAKEKKMARVIQSNKLTTPQQLANQNALNLCTPSRCLVCQIHFMGSEYPGNSPLDLDESGNLSSKSDRRLVEHLFTSEHLNNLISLYAKELKSSNNSNGAQFVNQINSPIDDFDDDSISH